MIKVSKYYYFASEIISNSSISQTFKAYYNTKDFDLNVDPNQSLLLKKVKNEYIQHCITEKTILSHLKSHSDFFLEILESFKTENHIYFIYPYNNQGSLEDIIKQKKKLENELIIDYISQIIEIFLILDYYKIIHRDLKPSNILIHNNKIKIFGFYSSIIESINNNGDQILASPPYMSPQLLKRENVNSKSDVWSLGIILFELLYQKNPWEGMEKLINIDKRNLLKIIDEGLIKTKNKTLFFPNNPNIPDEFQNLFLSMIEEDDKKRISFQELSNLPIFKNKIKIMKIPSIKPNMDCIKMNISNEIDSPEKSPEELKHEDFYEKTSSSKKNSYLYAINETNSPLEESKNLRLKKSIDENNIKDYDNNYKMFKSLNINEQTEQIISFSKESNKICLEEKHNNNNNNIVFISQLMLKSNLTYIPINKIIFGEIIKRGGFGIVFKAIINLIDYAVKKIVNVNDEFLLKVIKEASNLRNYENPRLIKIYGLSYNFHKNDELLDVYLIFELKQFDLKEAINSLKLIFSQKLRIALQIAQGVYFLHNHEKPLVHADLKPANILLDESLNIYIGDLGISKILDDAVEITSSKSCTLGYSSPEQTLCNRIGKYSDIWSLGLVYYFLFFEKNFEWDKNGLYQGKSLTILDKSQDLNEIKIQQLIEKMVVNDPNERIKIEDVIGYLKEIKI